MRSRRYWRDDAYREEKRRAMTFIRIGLAKLEDRLLARTGVRRAI
jgi:hypothetical protein